MKYNFLKYLVFVLSSTILIFFDQFTKFLALKNLSNGNVKKIIDGILEFVYVENSGAAFGILKNQIVFFIILTVIVIFTILVYLHRITFTKKDAFLYIFLILIFSGAMGNFIDRIKNQYVIDFIYFVPIDFPVFNLADTYITLACVFMILNMIF